MSCAVRQLLFHNCLTCVSYLVNYSVKPKMLPHAASQMLWWRDCSLRTVRTALLVSVLHYHVVNNLTLLASFTDPSRGQLVKLIVNVQIALCWITMHTTSNFLLCL